MIIFYNSKYLNFKIFLKKVDNNIKQMNLIESIEKVKLKEAIKIFVGR